MLASIVDRHSKIGVTPETWYFEDVEPIIKENESYSKLLEILKKSRCRDLEIDLDNAVSEEIWMNGGHKAAYTAILLAYGKKRNKPIVAEKSPIHLLRLQAIVALLDNVRVVVIVRDGRAAIDSLLRMPWGHNNLVRYSGEWCHWMRELEKCSALYQKKILTIKYEDLIENPEKVLKKIMVFYGFEYENELLSATSSSGTIPEWEKLWKSESAGPIKNKKNEWLERRNAKERINMESIMGVSLKRLGYSLYENKISAASLIKGWVFSLPLWFTLRYYIKRKKILNDISQI